MNMNMTTAFEKSKILSSGISKDRNASMKNMGR